ncbi:helix-turn-helix domain-containing protein [Streptomyces sp. NBC_00669]|uniref:helix-turn-helix domain-containing protein n=1 Tax=Streptomyces sp. NBC_00669 TaxID=2976011 RepID=UPI002E3753E0|nr:hypothetical protein [Streptomyces sp. NBC_00669]
MAGAPEQIGLRLKAARQQRGWSQPRLVSELRCRAQVSGQALPADASVKRGLASWENGHSVPDEFYGLLLAGALDLGAAELGLSPSGVRDGSLVEVRYPAIPEAAISGVDQLWRADLHGYEPLLHAALSEPAWSDASLRCLVTPEPAPLTADTRNGTRVGLTDVAVIKYTGDTFAMLDDQFGREHARHAMVQYLSAWMSYDAGQHGLAQRYFLQSLRFAQDS